MYKTPIIPSRYKGAKAVPEFLKQQKKAHVPIPMTRKEREAKPSLGMAGKGKWKGKEVTAWGRYVDKLVLTSGKGDGGVPGSSGKWLISRRETVFMGRLGEEGVMEGE